MKYEGNMLLQRMKEQSRDLGEFRADEDGVGTIELVLILVVLIGLVVIFKDSITDLLNSIFVKINANATKL